MNALQFGRIAPAVAVGERDARIALAAIQEEVPIHAS
jgi:hypothetical protein